MKKSLRSLVIAASSITSSLVFSLQVFAASCGGVETSYDYQCDPGKSGITGLIFAIVNFLAVGVGIAVVGGIIWGGIVYATSEGDAGKTKQGISIITNAVIALILFIFMYAALNYLVPGGLFN